MLAGSYIRGTISKYQNETPKVGRKEFNTGEVWNKLAEISFFIIFDQNLVECVTSSIG